MPKNLIKHKSTSEKKQNRGKNKNLKNTQILGGKKKSNKINNKTQVVIKQNCIKMYQNKKLTDVYKKNYEDLTQQEQQWYYEQQAQKGPSALRNIPRSSAIFEEEQKNKSTTHIQSQQDPQQDDYSQSGSINYKGYEYNQRSQQEKQQEEYQNSIKNFKDMQQMNTQAQQRQQNYKNNQTNQNQNREPKQEQYQTRRNYREQRNESSQSRYSDTNSYRTRNSRQNSRSNSRQRRNQNYNRNRRNNRQQNNQNYFYRNNRKQFYRNYQEKNYQQKNEEKPITSQMLKEQEKNQEQTCRYWQSNTCKNYQCERKHYQMIKLMNMYYKPKSKRIKNNITDYNIIEKEIQQQEITVQIEITRQMKIEEIQKFIARQSQKLEQKKINNIKIRMAVKDNRKIIQEIENIRNAVFLSQEPKDIAYIKNHPKLFLNSFLAGSITLVLLKYFQKILKIWQVIVLVKKSIFQLNLQTQIKMEVKNSTKSEQFQIEHNIRWQVIGYFECCHNQQQTSVQFGIHQSSVSRILSKFQITGDVKNYQKPKNEEYLSSCIINCWESIPQSQIQSCIQHFQKRFEEVYTLNRSFY